MISTTTAPGAVGPYSQAIEANGFVFVSGQLPLDPATGAFVPGGTSEQAEQSIKNLLAVLEAAGCKAADAVNGYVTIKAKDPDGYTVKGLKSKMVEFKAGANVTVEFTVEAN